MTITATSNKGLIKPAAGTEDGTWAPYANASPAILDNVLGGSVTIPLSASNVILSSAQYQCNFLTFTGALGATVTITLPPVGSFYTVYNLTTNSCLFHVVSATPASSGENIGAPPGEAIDVLTDGTNVKFKNLGRVGTFIDFASSGIPGWITACTVAPYIYCNGAAFSSATYPLLRNYLGSAVVPDCRARTRFSIDDGSSRIGNILSGNTIGSVGGVAANSYSSTEVPLTFYSVQLANVVVGSGSGATPVSANTPSSIGVVNMPPALMVGLTMIRAG